MEKRNHGRRKCVKIAKEQRKSVAAIAGASIDGGRAQKETRSELPMNRKK